MAATINGDYLEGLSLPWNAYGADFGTGPWGYLADWNAVTSEFSTFQSQGVDTVRWWVFGDGRYSPVFNPDGSTAGLNSGFLADIDRALQIASENHVKLLLTLTDFTMFNFPVVEGGVQLGGHQDIINDPADRQSFLDNALKPLLEHIAASPYKDAVLGYDIMNEPEAQIAGGYNGSDFFMGPAQFALSDVQSFVAQAADYIHTYSGGGLATVGSAMPIWAPLWQGLGLDFYQVHYYPWMDWAGEGTGLPNVSDITSDTGVHLDKPVVLGEFPTADASYGLNDTAVYSAEWYLNYAFTQGYAGVLGWSLTAGDGASNWNAFAPVFTDWVHDHETTPPPPDTGSVSITDATILEGDSGADSIIFTVNRSGGTDAFDVSFVTSDGTATTADNDYVAASGTLHFAAGQNTATASVAVNGDTKVELDESFNFDLYNPTNGATFSDSHGVGTIVNNDVAPPPTTINGTNGHDTLYGTAGDDTINGKGGQDQIKGGAGNDTLHGNGGKDWLDGGPGADTLWGDTGADEFIFKAGEANGDIVKDFSGNGARTGDILEFIGYGSAQDGASFTKVDATHYQINSADGLVHDTITLNATTVNSHDFLFL